MSFGNLPALVRLALVAVVLTGGLIAFATQAAAADVTFAGTVSYTGTHAGDSLYVAVLDTVSSGGEDVSILAIEVYEVSAPPFSQPYSLTFDNTTGSAMAFVVALLDVDGGGTNEIGGLDVFGWYDSQANPQLIATNTSQSGLDFSLPTAEIQGTLTRTGDMFNARPDATLDALCLEEGFRPRPEDTATGPYVIRGLYPGAYCVSAEGSTGSGSLRVCFGDPDCESPTLVTLSAGEIRTGVDLDFTTVAVEEVSWGMLKGRYR